MKFALGNWTYIENRKADADGVKPRGVSQLGID
jgi:hypothetical protein